MNALAVRQMRALFRVEWILFNRIRSNYFMVFVVPAILLVGLFYVQREMPLESMGLSVAPIAAGTSVTILLIFTLYSAATGLYVARREELVLKRLRTSEAPDAVILAGGASLYVVVTLGQVLVSLVGLSLLLGSAPKQPVTVLLALVTGVPLMLALAVLTAVLCSRPESTLVGTIPVLLILPIISGAYVPFELMPGVVGDVLAFAPMSSTVALVRSGWTGDMSAAGAMTAVLTEVVWAAVFVWIARGQFRWEPRT